MAKSEMQERIDQVLEKDRGARALEIALDAFELEPELITELWFTDLELALSYDPETRRDFIHALLAEYDSHRKQVMDHLGDKYAHLIRNRHVKMYETLIDTGEFTQGQVNGLLAFRYAQEFPPRYPKKSDLLEQIPGDKQERAVDLLQEAGYEFIESPADFT